MPPAYGAPTIDPHPVGRVPHFLRYSICPAGSNKQLLNFILQSERYVNNNFNTVKTVRSDPPSADCANLRNRIGLWFGSRTPFPRQQRTGPAPGHVRLLSNDRLLSHRMLRDRRRRFRRPYYLLHRRSELSRSLEGPRQRPIHAHAGTWIRWLETRRPMVRLCRPLASGRARRSRMRCRP